MYFWRSTKPKYITYLHKCWCWNCCDNSFKNTALYGTCRSPTIRPHWTSLPVVIWFRGLYIVLAENVWCSLGVCWGGSLHEHNWSSLGNNCCSTPGFLTMQLQAASLVGEMIRLTTYNSLLSWDSTKVPACEPTVCNRNMQRGLQRNISLQLWCL